MKLTDLDRSNVAVKALKEGFAFNFDIAELDRPKTLAMLKKVSGLIKESRRSPEFHKAEANPTYMKMLFMEQALTEHMKVAKAPRIVLENEEVEKSQVIKIWLIPFRRCTKMLMTCSLRNFLLLLIQ